MTFRHSIIAMSTAFSLSAFGAAHAQQAKPAKPDHDMKEMQKAAEQQQKEIAKAQDKQGKTIEKARKEAAKDASHPLQARHEPKAEERREHKSFVEARQQSQRLTKGVRLTSVQRVQFEELRKRYDTQYKALEKEEMRLDKARASDTDVLRQLDALRAQERAELRAMLTPAQQTVFDRNQAGKLKSKR